VHSKANRPIRSPAPSSCDGSGMHCWLRAHERPRTTCSRRCSAATPSRQPTRCGHGCASTSRCTASSRGGATDPCREGSMAQLGDRGRCPGRPAATSLRRRIWPRWSSPFLARRTRGAAAMRLRRRALATWLLGVTLKGWQAVDLPRQGDGETTADEDPEEQLTMVAARLAEALGAWKRSLRLLLPKSSRLH